MTERQTDVLVGIAVLCALTLTGLVVRREFFPPSPAAAQERHVDDWQKYGSEGLTLGSANAPVRIVVFSDYQCPYCARLSKSLSAIRRERNIAITYRNYPLESSHPFALGAALAAECANAQGRFPELHEVFVARRDSIGIKSWESFAEAAGIPRVPEFMRCVSDSTYIGNVRRDIAAGDALGIEATPTLLIRDRAFTGDPGSSRLYEMLASASK